MKNIIFLLLVILFGCKRSNLNCILTNEQIVNQQSKKIVTIPNDSANLPDDLGDRGLDSLTRIGYYTFYKNKNLKSYRFFATNDAYTYNEEYDIDGNLKKTEGGPLVFTNIKEIGKDSAFFQLYFSRLNRVFDDSVLISMDNRNIFKVNLIDDSLRSYISISSFGINTKGFKKFKVYISTNYVNSCNYKKNTLLDTLAFTKD